MTKYPNLPFQGVVGNNFERIEQLDVAGCQAYPSRVHLLIGRMLGNCLSHDFGAKQSVVSGMHFC